MSSKPLDALGAGAIGETGVAGCSAANAVVRSKSKRGTGAEGAALSPPGMRTEKAGLTTSAGRGGFGWGALLATLAEQGWSVPRTRPTFAHGAEVRLDGPDGRVLTLLGCFHVSQQNTFTGRLTPAMLDAVLLRARELVGL